MKPLFFTLLLASSLGAQTLQVPARTPISGLQATGAERVQLRFGGALLDDERFSPSKAPQIDGPPGLYTLRFTRGDKARTPVGREVSVVVPGVLKTPGQWLFSSPSSQGALFVSPATEFIAAPPRFLPGLRANSSGKTPIFAATPLIQEWATVSLSPADGAPLVLPAQTPRSGFYVGYEFSPTPQTTLDNVRAMRVAIEKQSSGAALILQVRTGNPLEAARQLDEWAPLCDAIHLQMTNEGAAPLSDQLWPLKVARRIAEEREKFDLPIWVSLADAAWNPALAAEIFASGATGLIGAPPPLWGEIYGRNVNWLLGAVTLEDAAIWGAGTPGALKLADSLRAAGRIPLLGRTPTTDKNTPEPLIAILNEKTTDADLEGLRRAAAAGQTVYLEGLPPASTWEKFGKWASLKISALPASKPEILTLDDLWMWGTANKTEINVTQSATVTVVDSLAARVRDEKGLARETKARSIGFLTSEPNGLLLAPVGKGRILWAPHAFSKTPPPPFFGAISGVMQPALAAIETNNPQALRIAFRQSQGGTPLLFVFNTSSVPQNLQIRARAQSDHVFDLKTETALPSSQRGFTVSFGATLAGGDYGVWALFPSRDVAQKERAFAPFKARLR